jgi:hypothetical protein
MVANLLKTSDYPASSTQRSIIDLPRDKDGMYIEPNKLTPETEIMLAHNRERFAVHFNYADDLGAGNPHSYDEKGNYNCGRCNQAEGEACLLVDIPKIDRTAGSCEDWERIRAYDSEMHLRRKKPEVANYGVAKNGAGFGCKRCPYSRPAKSADSDGRTSWCGEGGFHIILTGCCTANGAETMSAKRKT